MVCGDIDGDRTYHVRVTEYNEYNNTILQYKDPFYSDATTIKFSPGSEVHRDLANVVRNRGRGAKARARPEFCEFTVSPMFFENKTNIIKKLASST